MGDSLAASQTPLAEATVEVTAAPAASIDRLISSATDSAHTGAIASTAVCSSAGRSRACQASTDNAQMAAAPWGCMSGATASACGATT